MNSFLERVYKALTPQERLIIIVVLTAVMSPVFLFLLYTYRVAIAGILFATMLLLSYKEDVMAFLGIKRPPVILPEYMFAVICACLNMTYDELAPRLECFKGLSGTKRPVAYSSEFKTELCFSSFDLLQDRGVDILRITLPRFWKTAVSDEDLLFERGLIQAYIRWLVDYDAVGALPHKYWGDICIISLVRMYESKQHLVMDFVWVDSNAKAIYITSTDMPPEVTTDDEDF